MKTNQARNNSIISNPVKRGLFVICTFLSFGLGASAQDIPSINKVFSEFQSGYRRRDTSMSESFGNRLFARDIFILGTNSEEWVNGLVAAKKLVKNDWDYWMNLSIDTTRLNLHKVGHVYLFAVAGTAYIQFPSKDAAYRYSVQQINNILKNENNNRLKLLALSKESANLISEIEKGDLNIRYQIRLTGVLSKQDGQWVFQQLVYSFPYPMQRK